MTFVSFLTKSTKMHFIHLFVYLFLIYSKLTNLYIMHKINAIKIDIG